MSNEMRAGDSWGAAPVIWEYNVLQSNVDGFFGPNIDVDYLKQLMDEQGASGWELVNTVDINRGKGRTTDLLFVFKRPAKEGKGRSGD